MRRPVRRATRRAIRYGTRKTARRIRLMSRRTTRSGGWPPRAASRGDLGGSARSSVDVQPQRAVGRIDRRDDGVLAAGQREAAGERLADRAARRRTTSGTPRTSSRQRPGSSGICSGPAITLNRR